MKKERNNTIITEYCYEKTNYNLYQSCLKEKVFSDVPNVAKFSLERTLSGIRTLPVLHTIFISVYEKLWEDMKKKN